MILPLMLSQEEIVQRYGVSMRLAVRVRALLAKELGVTATVVEAAKAGTPIEGLLLDKLLLDKGASLTGLDLLNLTKAHARDTLVFDDMPLTLAKDGQIETGGMTVLCLEEELLAAQAPGGKAAATSPTRQGRPNELPPLENAPARVENLLARIIQSDHDAIDKLFTPEEIARLKIEVLTGTSADAKIAALRKLALLNLDPNEKGAIFLQALSDDAPAVRAESAKCLNMLGLSETITEAIVRLSGGNPDEQAAVLPTLASLGANARPAEQAVLLAVLLGTLRAPSSPRLLSLVLDALEALAAVLVEHAPSIAELDSQFSRLLLTQAETLGGAMHRVFVAIIEAAGSAQTAGLDKLFRKRWHDSAHEPSRAFYLSLLAEYVPDEETMRTCLGEITRLVVTGSGLDASIRRLTASLRRYGGEALTALLERFDGAGEDLKHGIVRVVTTFAYDRAFAPGRVVLDGLVDRLADVYDESRTQVRLAILECPYIHDPVVSVGPKRRIAQAIIDDLREHELEQTREFMGGVLRKLGPGAITVLMKAARASRFRDTRLRAVQAIGDIARSIAPTDPPGPEAVAARLERYFEKAVFAMESEPAKDTLSPEAVRTLLREAGGQLWAPPVEAWLLPPEWLEEVATTHTQLWELLISDDFPDKGPVYVAIGRLAFTGGLPAETVVADARAFLDRIYVTGDAYAVVEALGFVGAARGLTEVGQREIAGFLAGLLKGRFPERMSRVVQTDEGIVFELGHETTAYTDLIPRIVAGLQRIVHAPETVADVREYVVDTLLDTWHRLADYSIIWGPKNTIDFAAALAHIGRDPRIAGGITARILKALQVRGDNLTIMAVIGELLSSLDDSDGIAQFAYEQYKRLEQRVLYVVDDKTRRERERDEWETIVLLMLRVATRERIGATPGDANAVRRDACDHAFDALRQGVPNLAWALRLLARLPYVEAELADEIPKRLRKLRV